MRIVRTVLSWLPLLALTSGCAHWAPQHESSLALKVKEEVRRDGPLEVKRDERLSNLEGRHFLFVAGLLNEPMSGYFADSMAVVGEELQAESSLLSPSSLESVSEEADHIREVAMDRFRESGKPVVIIGHSKGGAGAVLAVLRYPELILSGAVDRVIAIQSPLGGSPLADAVVGTPRGQRGSPRFAGLAVRIEGLDSLTLRKIKPLFAEAQARLRAQQTPEAIAEVTKRVYYVRSCQQAFNLALELEPSRAYLAKFGSGESDGLVLEEDMKLAGFGTDLGILRSDHASLTVASALSRSSVSERKAFTRALLREVFAP